MNNSTSVQPVVVDDGSGNPALVYVDSDNWTHLYNYAGEQNGTVSYTTTNGSSIIFTFNGTAVGVAGIVLPAVSDAQPPISLYSVDGSPPFTYTAPDNATSETKDVSFYANNTLSAGVHTLVINITRTENNMPFLLDYIAYLPAQPSSSSSSTPTASSLTSSQSHVPIPSFTGQVSGKSSSSTPVGAIVGGVLGGAALLIFTVLGSVFLYRRRVNRQLYVYERTDAGDMLNTEVKPQPHEGFTPELGESVPPPTSATIPTSSSPSFGGNVVVAQNIAGPSLLAGALPAKAAYTTQSPPVPETPAVYHADSGVRFTNPAEPSGSSLPPPPPLSAQSDILDDLPPEYTPN